MTSEKTPFDQPVELPIDGELDLHTFRPAELVPLLQDYIEACRRRDVLSLRIIHGKGQGVMRDRVHQFLSKCPHVQTFQLAPPEAGGWGATLVELIPASEGSDF